MLKHVTDGEDGFWRLLWKRRFGDAFEVLGSAPWLWVVVAVCPVVVGVLASFWPDRIKAGYLPAALPTVDMDPVPTVFWIAVVLTGASFGLTQWSQSRAGAGLRTMVRRLQTLPPSGFLQGYRKAFEATANQALLVIVNDQATQSEIEHAIRNVLGSVVELAKDFDEQGDAVYGANLMVWRPADEPFESAAPVHIVPYVRGDPGVLGYLELVKPLATTTALKGNNYSVDPDTSEVVVPVSKDTTKFLVDNSRFRDPVLPGAPQAFITGDFVAFESIDKFIQWLNENSSRGLEVTEPLKKYFLEGAGKHVKSFGSRPIAGVGEERDQPVAVLNVHSDRENLLQDSGQTLFAPLIEPFCVLIATLLKKREVLLSGAGVPASPRLAPSSVTH